MITTTPSPSSAAATACATAVASVPRRSSDVPAAISIRRSWAMHHLQRQGARAGPAVGDNNDPYHGYSASSAASASKSSDIEAAPGSICPDAPLTQ